MGIGLSVLLIAIGAVLVWAVDASVSGVELQTIGWILLVVGVIGAVVAVVFTGRVGRRERDRTIIDR